ncbi:hypothetical protein LCGC14_2370990, partial [marine sediment metagenome]
MYFNGYYTYHVLKFDYSVKSGIKENTVDNFITPKEEREIDVTYKLSFRVDKRYVAEELTEFFANSKFNIITITDFYKEAFNGIYDLIDGNVVADGGDIWWTVTCTLQNRGDRIRYSHNQDVIDNDFEILQTKTSTFGSLVNGNAEVGTWGTSGNGFGCTVDSGTNIYKIG